jgi:transketolase
LRARVLRAIAAAPSGHPGGSLSVIDILAAIMLGWGRFAPNQATKDWLVLSKGHAAPALYSVLVELGYISEDELVTYRRVGSRLQGHPDRLKLPAVQITTGHLGQGLSIGVGLALGERMRGSDAQVYVILGEGDLHEGQTWEAMMAASHYGLGNLTALADLNGLTQHGPVAQIMGLAPLDAKCRAFGWSALEIDGHDYAALMDALGRQSSPGTPRALLCHTIKGKGVSFMEGDPLWHSGHLSRDDLERALRELERVA